MPYTSRNAQGDSETFDTMEEAVAWGSPDYVIQHPGGKRPACKNKVGTWRCERCGRDVRGKYDVCPGALPEDRWDFHPGYVGCIVTPGMITGKG